MVTAEPQVIAPQVNETPLPPPPVKKSHKRKIPIDLDPVESAKRAGLRYVTTAIPGISRKRAPGGFRYTGPDGHTIEDAPTLKRIKKLVIPPAWREVWVCPIPNGHLQVVGRDQRGRKQSRYHERWRTVRDENKYARMIQFGDALPVIRRQVEHDLALRGLPREKVLAAVVRLMETTSIRIGNEEYARENHSYGLTTMHNRHVEVKGANITFDFTGKSGVHHTIDVHNRHLAKIVQRCHDLPGYELFQYLDDDGKRHAISSSEVNEYLHHITGQHFTAKDFRTWAGTVLAAMLLRDSGPFESQTQAKKNVLEAIKSVAERLGNTPTVCRKCYIHPAVLEQYYSGAMLQAIEAEVAEQVDRQLRDLREEELALLNLLSHSVVPPANPVRKRTPPRPKAPATPPEEPAKES